MKEIKCYAFKTDNKFIYFPLETKFFKPFDHDS